MIIIFIKTFEHIAKIFISVACELRLWITAWNR